ncbi:hypothetical protein B0A54_00027 [Friedmanniomyces endolithicus]|uniref:Uncharacterized protein n=1 Tax=Friedmanniomyces endolithicus TaxID=329885 RepID=A0A4U0VJ72_9PEZI|nr:hypothetical protein LTS09_013790 [Friedmanniomyces endolithicus]TKA49361.1 hypothetical protein B0A54_00027 [Friedmanniomyces endolithicus]
MVGYRRPLTTGAGPTELRGFNALEKAFAEYRPLNHGSLRRKSSIEAKRQSVPATWVKLPSSDEDESSAESRSETLDTQKSTPIHESSHFVLKPARRLVTPPHLTGESFGLPPTPPTMANSDDNEPRAESLATNVQFADAVRDALQRRKSGMSTPAGHLPTPDPSPPGTSEDLTSPADRPLILHPLSAHHLRQYASSRAESFHTAREEPSRSQHHLPQTPSPEPQPLMPTWLNSTRDARLAKIVSGQTTDPPSRFASRTPEYALPPRQTMPPYVYATPVYSRRAKRAASLYHTPEADPKFEKHISYLSNEEEAGPYFLQPEDANIDALVASTWLNGSPMEEETSAEGVNNLVYKQIQEENAERHILISHGSAAATGLALVGLPTREHKLKRTARHESLRHFSSASDESRRDSADIIPKPLRPRKAQQPVRSLEASPVVERSPPAQRVLPKSREPDSPMARFTRAAMASEGEPANDMRRAHTLRHASKTKRLETSIPSRRASAETGGSHALISPDSSRVASPPLVKLRHFRRHSLLEKATPLHESTKTPPHITPYLAQELHPGMEPERTIRHFSNETKLENNSRVRRTSLEHNSHLRRTSLEKYGLAGPPAPPRKNSWEMNGGILPASPRLNYWDMGSVFMPASPRKTSLDARLQHPITTPMSISQLSDQTAVEVCEAKSVVFYPHNNHSLLVVQHGVREGKPDNYLGLTNQHLGIGTPLFSSHVQEPTPTPPRLVNPTIHVDSPLTNPRAAPYPPALQVIPPTPCSELDRQLSNEQDEDEASQRTPVQRPGIPQRRQSLIQRARRFSETFIEQPLFGRSQSLRSNRASPRQRQRRDPGGVSLAAETRPQTLSPLWQPRRFWDGYDSEPEYDEEDAGMRNNEDIGGLSSSQRRLPAGGDTSSVDSQRQRRRLVLLPRSLSLRMPAGFRTGSGGGRGGGRGMSRQRGYVVRKRSSSSVGGGYVSQGRLRKRASAEMLKGIVGGGGDGDVGAEKGVFTLPFSGGRRVQYVGVAGFRERMWRMRAEKEEREREARREVLRGGIVHQGV